MKHEKSESYPDDYKPQCECKQTVPVGAFKTEHWFSVGYAERKANGSVACYLAFGKIGFNTFEEAKTKLDLINIDYNRRGIAIPKDEFCVIEHTETFYLI